MTMWAPVAPASVLSVAERLPWPKNVPRPNEVRFLNHPHGAIVCSVEDTLRATPGAGVTYLQAVSTALAMWAERFGASAAEKAAILREATRLWAN
jgi:hypothetical protein